MSVIGYSTCRTVRSRSTTSVSRLSRLTPAARNVGSRRAAVSVRSASEGSGKRSPSFSAKARCSSGRCTETPCTVAPTAVNSANWSRYVHDSRRETPSSCWSASNRCTPRAVSRTISRVHQPPTTSSAWAIEQSASARLVLRLALRRGRGRHPAVRDPARLPRGPRARPPALRLAARHQRRGHPLPRTARRPRPAQTRPARRGRGGAAPRRARLRRADPRGGRVLRRLLAAGAGAAVLAARRLPGPGEKARIAANVPEAETGSPERAPAG